MKCIIGAQEDGVECIDDCCLLDTRTVVLVTINRGPQNSETRAF